MPAICDLILTNATVLTMDRALRKAKKPSELVVYPELRHDLLDGTARADMLRKSEEFLRTNLAM